MLYGNCGVIVCVCMMLAGAVLKQSIPLQTAFKRVSQLFGIAVAAPCLREIEKQQVRFFLRSSPFGDADIKDSKAVIKQTPFTRYCQGTKAFIQALNEPKDDESG